ncbi:MAG: P-loop NTPase [Nitrospinae bacterium]|nr:P-loop NTPase [Nitrospinota bacterium]
MRMYHEVAGDGGSDILGQVGKMMERLAGRLSLIKSVIAVASPKGGVGKSTVAAHLAASLARRGARVGALDADLYGSSLPRLLAPEFIGANATRGEEGLFPIAGVFGVRVMSLDYLTGYGARASVAWAGAGGSITRGPVEASALRELLADTQWGELDYLIVDTPPSVGRLGDLTALVPSLAGVVLVSAPTLLAYQVTLKSIERVRALGVPLLGLVENMRGFTCDLCGAANRINVEGEMGETLSIMGVPALGALPYDQRLLKPAGEAGPIEAVERIADALLAKIGGHAAARA